MKLLTETEVAAKLEVTKPCLRRWRHEGRELPFVRVGRLVRYRPQDVERFIADHTQDIAPKAVAVSRPRERRPRHQAGRCSPLGRAEANG
jgi:excisionase family DNA binding protein